MCILEGAKGIGLSPMEDELASSRMGSLWGLNRVRGVKKGPKTKFLRHFRILQIEKRILRYYKGVRRGPQAELEPIYVKIMTYGAIEVTPGQKIGNSAK